MKKFLKVFIIVIVILLLLFLINFIRNYVILTKISKMNIETFKNLDNYTYSNNSFFLGDLEGSSEWITYYKDDISLTKLSSFGKLNQIIWKNHSTGEIVATDGDGNKLEHYTDTVVEDYIFNALPLFKEDSVSATLKSDPFLIIVKNKEYYILKDFINGTNTYIEKSTGIQEKYSIHNNSGPFDSITLFTEDIVTDEDITKPLVNE